jgi:hypothetical protein
MRLRLPLTLTLLWAGSLTACGDDGSPATPPIPPVVRQAVINVVHASPDAPAVDIYVDQKKAVTLAFHKSSGNVSLPAGSHQLDLRPAGADSASKPVYSASLALNENTRTLLAAVGRLGDTSGPTKFAVNSYPFGDTDSNAVKVRLLHASPSAPAVDIAAGSSTLIADGEFGKASTYASVAGTLAANTKLGVRPFGVAADLVFATVPTDIAKGGVLTAIAFGEINPLSDASTFFSVSALDEASGKLVDLPVSFNSAGPKASLYVFHGSPDAPAVDVTLKDGSKLLTNLAYQKASPLLQLTGGAYDIQVRPAGTANAVLSANAKLIPGLSWTFVAYGLAAAGGDPKTALGLVALPQAAKGANTQVRAIHLVPTAPAVDIKAGPATLISGLTYPNASAYLAADIPAGVLTVQTTTTPPVVFNVTVDAATAAATKGQVVSLFATGNLGVAAKPFTVIGVIESSGDTTTPPITVPLPTVAKP